MRTGVVCLGLLVACGSKKEPSGRGGSAAPPQEDALQAARTANDAGAIDAADMAAPTQDAATTRVTIDPARRISAAGVGALTAKTNPKLAVVKKLVPTLTWRTNITETGGEEVRVIDGSVMTDPRKVVLRIVPEAKMISNIHVFGPGFVTDTGLEVGQTAEALAKAYPDVACTLDSDEFDELSCTSASVPFLRFSLEVPRGIEPGDVEVTAISRQRIETIHWSIGE